MAPVTKDEFALRIEAIRKRLYKTALLYLGNETQALDVVDETVYKALCGYRKLREAELFDTWITRILINECYNELRRQKRVQYVDIIPEKAVEKYDALPLKDAILHLPKELKDIIVLRYIMGLTLVETAEALEIPQGTAATRQRKALKLLKLEWGEEASV